MSLHFWVRVKSKTQHEGEMRLTQEQKTETIHEGTEKRNKEEWKDRKEDSIEGAAAFSDVINVVLTCVSAGLKVAA